MLEKIIPSAVVVAVITTVESAIIAGRFSLRVFLSLLTHWIDIEEICHLHVENSSGLQVHIDKVIWTMPVDRNDEMEMRVNVAKLANYIDDDDVNNLASNRNTAAGMPQSLSFYTMFYKMIIDGEIKLNENMANMFENKHVYNAMISSIKRYVKQQQHVGKIREMTYTRIRGIVIHRHTHTHAREKNAIEVKL